MSAPAVAVSANGKKFASAWKDVSTGEPNVYWATSDSLDFPAGQLVHDETNGKQDHPSLCIDNTGTVWVAWEDSRSGRQQVWIRSSRGVDTGRAVSTVSEEGSFPTIVAGADLVGVVYEARSQSQKTIEFQVVESNSKSKLIHRLRR